VVGGQHHVELKTTVCVQKLMLPTLVIVLCYLLVAARAVLEATAFQVEEVLRAMRVDSGVELRVLKVDGGMTVNTLLLQFQVCCCLCYYC
jgi:ribulose kinase